MAKFEPARGPGPFGLAAKRDWSLIFRPDFLAGLAGRACAGLGQKRDWFSVSRGTHEDPHRHRHFDSRALTDKQNKEKWQSLPASFPASTKAISSGFFSYSNRQFRSVTTSPCMFFVSSFNQGRVSSRFHLFSSSPL